jgi:hypothetical protein
MDKETLLAEYAAAFKNKNYQYRGMSDAPGSE